MKQITQRLKNGRVEVLDVPPPVLAPDGVLVDVRASLLSPGTERSSLEAARRGPIGKARARPDQAREVLDKVRREGVRPTVEAVRRRLNDPSPVGYSTSGVVAAVGERVSDIGVGDRVACGGGGYAVHAEVNYVPVNLCVRLPDAVPFETGAFTTIGSIALHAVRQAEAHIGERVAVIGLGLVGQLTCRILAAAGCNALGIDLVEDLVDLAQRGGAQAAYRRTHLDPSNLPRDIRDCDSVIVTAATHSDDPIALAGALARDRARVVIVGDVGLTMPRAAYYGKELELRLSRSYGPGRYDRMYEERGLDYPIGYVRWTERRNLESFVSLLAAGRVAVDDLITARIPARHAADVYDKLASTNMSPLGVVITYEGERGVQAGAARERATSASKHNPGAPRVGVIGAGSFSQRMLIPALEKAGFALCLVGSATGASAAGAASRFGFECAVSPEEILSDERLDLVCVATRHQSHATYAVRALERHEAVFIEKPPALTMDDLALLREASHNRVLQVGFNRRYAPLAVAMQEYVVTGGHPVELLYRIAGGGFEEKHWLNDPEDGGGRFLGEGCHFVDFACWFVGALPSRVDSTIATGAQGHAPAGRFSTCLTFPDRSLATIVYGSESAPNIEKERVEAHSGGASAILTDFRQLDLYGRGRHRSLRNRHADKGHRAQMIALRRAIEGEPLAGPDPLDTMAITIEALRAAHGGSGGESRGSAEPLSPGDHAFPATG